jgi:hypothetical protein
VYGNEDTISYFFWNFWNRSCSNLRWFVRNWNWQKKIKWAHRYVANAWAMLSRYQNASAASREYCKAISRKTPSWATSVINLVQRRNRQDRNNKNIQSIISVNTNILLRRFRLKFLRIMCSISCYEERLNFENTLYSMSPDWVYKREKKIIFDFTQKL